MSTAPKIQAEGYKTRLAAVPRELRKLPQWVGWKEVARSGGPSKVLYRADSWTTPARSNTPGDWVDFDAAGIASDDPRSGFKGVGFVFSEGDPYVGIDFDGCLVAGEVQEWAAPWLERLEACYQEVSPSGTGIKVWCRGELSGTGGNRRIGEGGHQGVEIYDRGRFFTVTGDAIAPAPETIPDAQEVVAELYAWIKERPSQARPAEPPPTIPFREATGRWTAEERAVLYLAKVDPAISGRNGHGTTFRAACAIGPGFDLDPETAYRLIRDHYSPRCQPPWTDEEIRHKVDDAYRVATDRGFLLNKPLDRPAAPAAVPIAEPPPVDIEDVEILDRWPKLDPAVFYGVAGEFARLVDPHTEAAPVATLVQFLAAFGCMLGQTVFMQVGATRHHAKINLALTGVTGIGRKGTSWDAVLATLYEVDPAFAADCIQSGLISGEGLIHHVRDERWEEVKTKDKKTGAVSVELRCVDPGVSEKRLLAVETEMSRMLKAAARDANTLSDVIRQAWETDRLKTLGKISPAKATGAHVAIIAHTTQADVRRHLAAEDSANGFANRWLWVLTRRSKLLPDGGDLESVDLRPVVQAVRDAVEWARLNGPIRIGRDPSAVELWRAIYPRLTADREGGGYLSRGAPYVLRLAMIHAVLERCTVIRADHLEAAVALWDYAEASARLIFGIKADPREVKLLDALEAAPEGLTRKDISVEVFKRNLTAKEIGALLGELLTSGVIRREFVSTRGRPAERYFMAAEGTR
jgi:hypothetical protein